MPAKAKDLRKKDKTELLKEIDNYRNELVSLRVAQVTGGTPAKLAKIKDVRKSIAIALTVFNQTQKAKLREQFKKSSYKPLDLRRKLTRALRRRLTAHEAAAQTVRQQKKLRHFPIRRYALKA